jgi:hypothetical protein
MKLDGPSVNKNPLYVGKTMGNLYLPTTKVPGFATGFYLSVNTCW